MLAGEPGDPERECFPPSLRFRLDAGGTITDEHTDLLAAEGSVEGPAKDLALAQVVAQLLGVPSEEVCSRSERGFRQAKRERQHQARIAGFRSGIKVRIKGARTAAFLALIALVRVWICFDYQRGLTSANVENLAKKYGAIDSARASIPESGLSVAEAISTIAQEATRDPHYETALALLNSKEQRS